jgi:MFS family permease
MLILDVTVVAVALPDISADLGLGRQQLTWVVSGYTLAFGGLLLGGRAADLFGARRLVVVGLTLFAGASLLAGLAPTGWALLAGRVLQGLSAAVLSPSALSLVVTMFDGAERDRALGIWSALGGGGAALGLLLGGSLTAGPGWPWVFFVNVPVGLLLALSLRRALPLDAAGRSRGRLDLLGAALVTAATGTLIYALIQAGDRGWASAATGVLAATAVGLYLAFVARVRHAANPLMNLNLLVRRPVAVGTLLVLVATALMIAVFFLGSFYFQNHRGYNALHTGLLFLPSRWPPWPARPSPAASSPASVPGCWARRGSSSAGSACGSPPASTDPSPWSRGSRSAPPGPAPCSSSPPPPRSARSARPRPSSPRGS